MADLDPEVHQFVTLAQNGQRDAAGRAIAGLRDRLVFQENDALSDSDLAAVVDTSLKERYFPEAEQFLEGMSIADRLSNKNRIDLAQIAIETGRTTSAIAVLDRLADEFADDPHLFSEAKGIGGRAHKDLFLQALDGNRNAAQRHLAQALRKYSEGTAGAPENRNWLCGNLLALGARAQLEGFDLPGNLDIEAIAHQIEDSVTDIPETDRGFYDWSSLAESRISLGAWDGATRAVGAMLEANDGDIFKLTSTLRQFKTVWALPRLSDSGSLIVTGLERSILARPNGAITMDAEDIARQRETREIDLEAQFSNALLRGQRWMTTFLQMGNSVASVVDRNSGKPRGTCLVLNGGDIAPDLKDKLVGLTNDHVISEYADQYQLLHPLRPRDAAIRFTLSASPRKDYTIDKVIWSSPFSLHDVCLFTFAQNELPIAQSDFEIVDYLPPAPNTPPAEVFVISHPNPDEPSYSFQNTDLLMHDGDQRGRDTLVPGRIHYKTGTIKGSSGGVALNGQLKMIGLHHAGSDTITAIDGTGGTVAANEAIWIVAILNALRHDLPLGRTRATRQDPIA